jgi:predicted dehydrogenase
MRQTGTRKPTQQPENAMTRKVRWGILSTADIGMKKVTPAIMRAPSCEVLAIASRDLSRAEAAAAQLGIPRAYGSYEELLADPAIDAIYNPLPNHLHVDLTLAAVRAGKHVLCEKPMGLDAKDASRLSGLPKDLIVAEAFMVRHHPQWHRAREIAASGEIGEVRAIRSVFTYFNTDPANVRNMAEIGGGGVLDIGCYPVTAGRYFFGAEPERVVALIDRDPKFRTDRQASVIADFGGGRMLSFLVSTQLSGNQSVELLGTEGRVEIVIPFNAPPMASTALLIDRGETMDASLARREIIPACDQYTEQAENFARAVLGRPALGWGVDDAIASMRVLDAIFASERSGGWAAVAAA